MRIGIITTSYPRFAGDSAGHFVASHARFLVENGHDVEVIAASDDKTRDTDDVIHVTRVPSRGLFYTGGAPDTLERLPLRGAINAASFTARFTLAVQKRARHWDAIVAHWLTPSAIAALPTTKPILAIAHGGDIHTLRRMKLLAPALFLLRARKARLVFVSSELRDIAIAAAPRLESWLRDATVQPMGIDLSRFAAITPSATTEKTTLLIVSRLVPVKGIDIALRAFAELDDRLDEHHELVIAGDGPERATLEILAHQLNIDERVRFVGEVSTDERDRLLASAALVIVPSRVLPTGRTEGTPMIALEALASRVPVIASAVGGLKDLAAATLVPPDDVTALADAIDEVLGMGSLPAEDLADLNGAATLEALDWSVVGKRLMPTW